MKTRQEVAIEDRWNVESLYPTQTKWNENLKKIASDSQNSSSWNLLQKYQGTLSTGPEKVREVLDLLLQIDREITKLYTYAHLRHDENITDGENKTNYEKITTLIHAFSQETAWFQPELLALSDATLEQYLQSPLLADYRFYIEKMMRMKKHTLSAGEEKVLAFAGQALQVSHKTFSALNDADFKFGSVQDESGEEKSLTHGTYSLYIREQDRVLRRNAFTSYHQKFDRYSNTLCELLNGQVQAHLFNARARNFSGCLEAALYPKNIDVEVYHALIKAVHKKIHVLHRYMDLRKRVLKLDKLHLYDIYVPLTSAVNIRMPYKDAEKVVIDSVAPLGAEYQSFLAKGFQEGRWVDRYENENKRSGAYSSGCYDSMPYILMNYKDLLRDVFTLAHEAGHSMHSLYSRKHQPYHYSDYSIFLAEVASTFNEDLLSRFLIDRCKNNDEKIFLLNQKVEDIRGTLFRQTMFAEFELFLHQTVEKGIPLTPELLKKEYLRLNHFYFGPSTTVDQDVEIEWARIPHFYYNFYVFQYATGISAALALSHKVTQGNAQDREAYLDFLKGGSSKYPIEMLKMAGIDMTTSAPVEAAIANFDQLLDQLEVLLK
jgi:oligoendopeptidase F